LLTTFFFCKATDILSILSAKQKITAVCEKDNCDNEKTEVEKIADDDQQLVVPSISIQRSTVSVILKTVFSYTVQCENEIFKNLFSPPPELS